MKASARKAWEEKLDGWIARGWVNATHRQDILDDMQAPARLSGGPMLVTLGIVLLLFGVVSVLASNWELIPRPVRLGVLVSALAISYLAAWMALRKPGHEVIGHGLMLLGAGLFGVNVMLIAQMYHIDEHAPTGVLAWALGALAASFAAQSRPPLWLAFGLIGLWSCWEMLEFYRSGPHLLFLVPWAAGFGWAWRHGWSPEIRGAWVTFFVWYSVMLGATSSLEGWDDEDVVTIASLLPAALWLFSWTLDRSRVPWAGTLSALSLYGVVFLPVVLVEQPFGLRMMEHGVLVLAGSAVVYGALLAVLWRQGKGSPGLLVVPVIALLGPAQPVLYQFDIAGYWPTLGLSVGLLVGLAAWGASRGDRVTIVAAFLGFAAVATGIYFNQDWSFLARGAFFLIGGASLIAVALYGTRRKAALAQAGGGGQ